MIYEISGRDIIKLDLTNSHMITLSFDGSSALIFSAVEITNINILSTINENELEILLQQPFWKQPCINC